jgi:16S rRNA C1402 (ribose-2'-O) methylase RsmI
MASFAATLAALLRARRATSLLRVAAPRGAAPSSSSAPSSLSLAAWSLPAAASAVAAVAAAAPPPPQLAGSRARPLEPATLYVVSTPVGALRDITLRALDVLATADAILCEDSRATRRLLTAHGLIAGGDGEFEDAPWGDAGVEEGPGVVPRAAATAAASIAPRILVGGARADAALARLRLGQSVALVSDAGTPCLSDPGAQIVAAALAAGFAVRSVPGASAALAALVVSGWDVHSHYGAGRSGATERAAAARRRQRAARAGFAPLDSGGGGRGGAEGSDGIGHGATASPGFVWLGFLAPSGAARRAQLAAIASEPGTCSRTVMIFEAATRLQRTLRELDAACSAAASAATAGVAAVAAATAAAPRAVLVCRELTKLHEEQRRFGSLAEAAEAFAAGDAELRGEFTVLIGPAATPPVEVK